jgi:hypothetical protein
MGIVRAIAVAALLAGGCGGPKPAPLEGPAPPVGEAVPLPPAAGTDSSASGFKPGPGGFPVPSDADAGQAVGVDNTGYNIPRPKDTVYAQLRPELEKQGFRIETYIPQPDSHRMIMYKDQLKYIASVTTTDDKSCTLFVTVGPTDK